MKQNSILSDFVVSIGPNCQTAWNLKNHTEDYRRRPFDWWICPFFSALHMLSPQFRFELSPDDVRCIETRDTDTVYNRRLNLYHHHDFDRTADGYIAPNWAANLRAVEQKYQTLFEAFWRDFNKAERPAFVLGEFLTFRNNVKVENAGLEAPDFDIGEVTPREAAEMLFRRFPDKDLSVIVIHESTTETTEIEPPYYRVTRRDNGYRPVFLPPNAYQHPINVFRDGFEAIGLARTPNASEGGADSNRSPARVVRIESLMEKAGHAFSCGHHERGRKYLVAAYQLSDNIVRRKVIERIAASRNIDLLADDPTA